MSSPPSLPTTPFPCVRFRTPEITCRLLFLHFFFAFLPILFCPLLRHSSFVRLGEVWSCTNKNKTNKQKTMIEKRYIAAEEGARAMTISASSCPPSPLADVASLHSSHRLVLLPLTTPSRATVMLYFPPVTIPILLFTLFVSLPLPDGSCPSFTPSPLCL